MDPNDVVLDFVDLIDTLSETYDELLNAAPTDALRKQLSIDIFLRAAVNFESFRPEWHIAAINRDAARLREAVIASVRKTVLVGREYRGASGRVTVDTPRYPSVAAIREIVDPQGRNVAFGSAAEWKERARRELVDKYADRVVAVTERRMLILDAVVALRNCWRTGLPHLSRK